MSKLFETVAAFEAAIREEDAAWDALRAAADAAQAEVGGCFSIKWRAGVFWDPDGAPAGVSIEDGPDGFHLSHRQCPARGVEAASRHRLPEIFERNETARDAYCSTGEALINTRCETPIELLEKFRALALLEDDPNYVSTNAVQAALSAIEKCVLGAGGEGLSLPAATQRSGDMVIGHEHHANRSSRSYTLPH
jgi:hypothetical protein